MLCDALGLGGVETHVTTLANALAKAGHEVTVVSGGGALTDALCGVRHVTLPMRKGWRLPLLFFRLWRLLRKERFDVIHAHTRLTAFLCRPLARGRLVTTAHWVFDTAFPKGLLTTWGNETLAVSRDIADYLQSAYRLKEERIHITVNGIDVLRFQPRKTGQRKRRIVYCSRMDHDRADVAFLLLDALPTLPYEDFSLTILGDGDRFDELSARVRAFLSRSPRASITLTGGVTDVAAYLKDADIFIGVSRAALEGMASGCAVILGGNEGYLSVFDPKHSAVAEESNFCCRGAPKATAERLRRDLSYLLSLPQDALHAMGERNRRYVMETYSTERMTGDALAVYERICKRKVVLCGYFGFSNVGDTLLFRAFSEKLKKEGYRSVLPFSAKAPSLRALFALRRGYDLVFGGGNLLQDATSRRSLSFYLCCAALATGRVVLYGGLGPLSCEGEGRVARLLSHADAFYCRTAGDLAYAKRLSCASAVLSADPVLTLTLPKKKRGEQILLAFKAPPRESCAALLAFTLSLCRTFGKEHFFLYVMHPEDRAISRRIAKLCGIPVYEEGTEGFLSRLSECRAVFASRLHAGVAALAMGIPFSLWRTEEKCRYFVEDLRALADGAPFCSLFSFSDRPTSLLLPDGMQEALTALKRRI